MDAMEDVATKDMNVDEDTTTPVPIAYPRKVYAQT